MYVSQRSNFRPRIACLLFITALVLGACNAAPEVTEVPPTAVPTATAVPPTETAVPPTETPLPTDTPEPTATDTPEPTATTDFAATEAAEATAAFEALSSTVIEQLAVYDISADSGHLAWVGGAPVEVSTTGGFQKIYEPMDEGTVYSTYVLHVNVAWDSSTGFAGCGITFNSGDDLERSKQYEFITIRVSGLPLWAVQLIEFGDFLSSATGGAKVNGAINQGAGEVNEYVLIVRKGLMGAYANTVRLSNVIISSPSEGRIGFFAWQESGETTCTFSDAWVWALDE